MLAQNSVLLHEVVDDVLFAAIDLARDSEDPDLEDESVHDDRLVKLRCDPEASPVLLILRSTSLGGVLEQYGLLFPQIDRLVQFHDSSIAPRFQY